MTTLKQEKIRLPSVEEIAKEPTLPPVPGTEVDKSNDPGKAGATNLKELGPITFPKPSAIAQESQASEPEAEGAKGAVLKDKLERAAQTLTEQRKKTDARDMQGAYSSLAIRMYSDASKVAVIAGKQGGSWEPLHTKATVVEDDGEKYLKLRCRWHSSQFKYSSEEEQEERRPVNAYSVEISFGNTLHIIPIVEEINPDLSDKAGAARFVDFLSANGLKFEGFKTGSRVTDLYVPYGLQNSDAKKNNSDDNSDTSGIIIDESGWRANDNERSKVKVVSEEIPKEKILNHFLFIEEGAGSGYVHPSKISK